MHVRPQYVDRHIHGVTDQEDHDEEDGADHTATQHGAQLIEHGGDDTGGQSQGQQPRVGQDIAEIAGNAVKPIKPLQKALDRVTGFPPCGEQDTHCANARQHSCGRGHNSGDLEGQLCDVLEDFCGEQHHNEATHQQVPKDHIVDGIRIFFLLGQLIELNSQSGKQMQHADSKGENQKPHGIG